VASLIPEHIRAVAFDAVGTLLHPDPPAAVIYAETGKKFGSQLDVQIVGERFAAAFQRQEFIDHRRGLRTDETREVARWRAIVAEVLDEVGDPEECFRQLYEHFARQSSWRVEVDAAGVMHQLRILGYRLAIASNFDERLYRVMASAGLHDIAEIVVSAAVGWRKPARPFFDAVCHSVEAQPREVLYVGDDTRNDYEGARTAGMLPVLFDPGGQAPVGVRFIRRLAELID
jgi:putative hydrolase of the HAD superfamily